MTNNEITVRDIFKEISMMEKKEKQKQNTATCRVFRLKGRTTKRYLMTYRHPGSYNHTCRAEKKKKKTCVDRIKL